MASTRSRTWLWEISLDGPRPTASWRADPKRIDQRRTERVARNGHAESAGALLILPSGKSENNSMVGRTARMGGLLRELGTFGDLVILDTPPAMLTVEMTELAQLIDMVVVVVRQGRVSQRTLRSLGRHARAWPAELAGAVMTDVPAQSDSAAYYGGR